MSNAHILLDTVFVSLWTFVLCEWKCPAIGAISVLVLTIAALCADTSAERLISAVTAEMVHYGRVKAVIG